MPFPFSLQRKDIPNVRKREMHMLDELLIRFSLFLLSWNDRLQQFKRKYLDFKD